MHRWFSLHSLIHCYWNFMEIPKLLTTIRGVNKQHYVQGLAFCQVSLPWLYGIIMQQGGLSDNTIFLRKDSGGIQLEAIRKRKIN